ncbi:MAG TPA: sensor histidine kinase, partial [Chitinophagaceae bacterium]|nr:sensor histidine kinase [Chitinophagaceae bacterium]
RKDGSIVETEVRSQQLPDGRFLSVIRDLTERLKAERELAASYEAIRKLTDHLQNIREEERTNMAREIHDELGQQLTVLKMDISWLKKKLQDKDEAIQQKITDLLSMLDETVRTVRRISSELRPSLLDDLGLTAAIEWHLKEFEERSGLKTTLRATELNLQLPDYIKTGLFRIFQESLTNVARHAHAKKVEVLFDCDGSDIILRIVDDGKGFDKKLAGKRTLGILGMKERSIMMGGTYEIDSEPGKGTTVLVTVAMKKETKEVTTLINDPHPDCR